jgi:hypothetical protein
MVAFGPPETSEELSVGAGRPSSVLAFQASADPPYYRSRGMGAPRGDIWFLYAGENTQFSGESAVPVDAAREALGEYLDMGAIPTSIVWEEV